MTMISTVIEAITSQSVYTRSEIESAYQVLQSVDAVITAVDLAQAQRANLQTAVQHIKEQGVITQVDVEPAPDPKKNGKPTEPLWKAKVTAAIEAELQRANKQPCMVLVRFDGARALQVMPVNQPTARVEV